MPSDLASLVFLAVRLYLRNVGPCDLLVFVLVLNSELPSYTHKAVRPLRFENVCSQSSSL